VSNGSLGPRLGEQQPEERVRAAATRALTTARNDTGGKKRLQCGTDARLHERELFEEQRRSCAYIREPLPKGDGNDAPQDGATQPNLDETPPAIGVALGSGVFGNQSSLAT